MWGTEDRRTDVQLHENRDKEDIDWEDRSK
jgi:hypothetical protein